jgi:alpha-beta hydrolase superfamily lysophospholipase
MKQIKSGFFIILISLFLLFSCRSLPEITDSWYTQEEYFSYYSLNHWQGERKTDWIGQNGRRIWTWSFASEDYIQTIVYIHGYLDHSALNFIPFDFLIQRNYRIITFDLPGHGRSEGQRAGLESFNEYTDSLELVMDYWKLDYDKTIFMGHSTGGAILLDRLVNDTPMKGVILAAPLIQFKHFDGISFFLPLLLKVKNTIGVLKRPNSSNQDFNNMKKNDPMKIEEIPLNWPQTIIDWQDSLPEKKMNYEGPLLVLQGEKDHVVNFKRNMERIELWFPQAQIHRYPSLQHHVLNEADNEALYDDLADFLVSLE